LPVIRPWIAKGCETGTREGAPRPKDGIQCRSQRSRLEVWASNALSPSLLEGGFLAREPKHGSLGVFVLEGHTGHHESYYERRSVLLSDRTILTVYCWQWLIRRLSPDSNPIEYYGLPKKKAKRHFCDHGAESANVHLGSKRPIKRILQDMEVENPTGSGCSKLWPHGGTDWKEYRKR